MPFILQVRLALRLLWREAKSGELRLIFWALLLAITSATAIALFSARLDLAMQQRALEVLGADIRLESTTPIAEHWVKRADELGLRHTQTIHFPTMVMAADEMAMAAVKVVGQGYPLKGELSLENSQPLDGLSTQSTTQTTAQSHGPNTGEVWLEPRLVQLLQLQLGDSVEVGRSVLTFTGIIAKESDRGAGFYSFSPRLMMNHADLAGADLISTGSRVRWRLLLVGEPDALEKIQQYELAAQEKFQTLETSNQALAQRLGNAKRYLGLAAMLAVVLACVAVAMSAKHYAQRNFNVSALMRTFGLARKQVLTIYLLQLLALALLACVFGVLLAYGVQQVLLWLLAELLPATLPQAPIQAWLLGASSGFVSLLGFAIPYILPLSRVSPLKVLRQELAPMPLSAWLLNALALTALAGLLWLFTQDAQLTLFTLAGGVLVLAVLLGVLMLALTWMQQRLASRTLSLTWRFAWQHLTHNKLHSGGQILAFALTLMVMLLIFTLRSDLLSDWQQDLPQNAPNVFAINIQPYELEEFNQQLLELGLTPEKLYPTLPARLVSINQQSVSELPIADDNSVNRDLILSADNHLPEDNSIVAGAWHGDNSAAEELFEVSVEEKLAQRLGIKLQDTLTFKMADRTVEVTVTSLRQVDWGSMKPTFFMLLSAPAFAQQPITYMTSVYIPPNSQALAELIRANPSITFFDTSAILAQIQTLLEQVTLAIEWILVFVLMAAVLVLLASITADLPLRLKEGALVRTLGASSSMLRKAQIAEFALLALLSALLALSGAEILRWGLYRFVLDLGWYSLGGWWLILPVIAMLLMVVPSQWLLRITVRTPPVQVLRKL